MLVTFADIWMDLVIQMGFEYYMGPVMLVFLCLYKPCVPNKTRIRLRTRTPRALPPCTTLLFIIFQGSFSRSEAELWFWSDLVLVAGFSCVDFLLWLMCKSRSQTWGQSHRVCWRPGSVTVQEFRSPSQSDRKSMTAACRKSSRRCSGYYEVLRSGLG